MNSLPNLSAEEGAMSPIPTNEFGFEDIPVFHLSSQEGFTDDYNIHDYLKTSDISEPSESVDPTLSQLSLPTCPPLLSPLSVDTKPKPPKRKGASTASNPKKTTKGVRKPRKKKKVDDIFMNVVGDLKDVSLHSFGPLQRCGDMLKKAKCRIVKAKATIVKCDDDIRSGSMDEVVLQELDAKIALTKTELIKMCEDADKLRFEITQKNQSAHCLKMQAELELQESTKLFDTAASVRDKWRKEFDHAFQSDND